MTPERRMYLMTGGMGAIVWVLVLLLSGRSEAWDSPLFFPYGIPVMLITSAVAGYFQPVRPWRWGLAVVFPQVILLFVSNGPGSMFVGGLLVFGFLGGLCAGAAYLGARRRPGSG